MKEKDQLYAQPRDTVSGFVFDQSVVDVFPDMIQRSVPGYQTIIHMIGEIAARFAQNNSTLYDLGCSLGACTLSMAERIQTQDVSIVAVDNSPSMIAECQRRLTEQKPPVPVELLCEDIAQVVIQDASICILNFTLQFIPISQRRELMEKIAKGLKPGGVLILSEKLAFHDDDHERLMIDLHHHFKRSNGYSDLEIAQKRSSLENVLIPETLDAHKKRLYQAGFRAVECWFQCFNFASIVAFK